jgi:hypothetical protein
MCCVIRAMEFAWGTVMFLDPQVLAVVWMSDKMKCNLLWRCEARALFSCSIVHIISMFTVLWYSTEKSVHHSSWAGPNCVTSPLHGKGEQSAHSRRVLSPGM